MKPDSSGLIKTGYITAVLLPIVGFIVGIVVVVRGGRKEMHGLAIVMLSIVVIAITASLIEHYSQSHYESMQNFNHQQFIQCAKHPSNTVGC